MNPTLENFSTDKNTCFPLGRKLADVLTLAEALLFLGSPTLRGIVNNS